MGVSVGVSVGVRVTLGVAVGDDQGAPQILFEHRAENEAQPEAFASIFHSLWWAIVTLTTVGYGDVYPVTVGGKIFTFFVLVIGVGIVTVPAGLVASSLTRARELESEKQDEKDALGSENP